MMISVDESGMRFGPYEERDLFRIEKSELLRRCNGIKTVEFIYKKKKNILWFVEAKSSAPIKRPDNMDDYDDFISEISQKFVDSFNLYMAGVLERKTGHEEITDPLKKADYARMIFRFFLIINFSKGEEDQSQSEFQDQSWAEGLKRDLEKRMQNFGEVWKSEIFVMDHISAKKLNFIA
jgi:hypothetical protein